MRIAFVILAFAGGGGILVYLVAWVLIPVERPGEDLGTARPEEPTRRGSSSAAR
jgi:hypothetical protein